jgi:hypothetical protein
MVATAHEIGSGTVLFAPLGAVVRAEVRGDVFGLAQQVDVAEGSLMRVVPEGVGAAERVGLHSPFLFVTGAAVAPNSLHHCVLLLCREAAAGLSPG